MLEALASELPLQLQPPNETKWKAWAQREDDVVRARLEQGALDSMVNLLLFGTSFTSQPRVSFTHLSCDLKLLSIDDLEHNDDGWISALHLLTTEQLGTFDFGIAGSPPCAAPQQFVTRLAPPPTNCSNASIRFASILSAFLAHPELGLKSRLHLRDMRLKTFIERVTKVVGGFFKDKSSFYLDLADPASTTQPQAVLCQ